MAAELGTVPRPLHGRGRRPGRPERWPGSPGKPVDPKVDVPCEFTQTAELVLGQNNVPFWTRTVDRLAVAVTDEAPFSIEVVEPKVPLVRGGSMDLKVVAKRKPGFTAPIAVSLPWNPPGLGSAGGRRRSPRSRTRPSIPINANGGAELKTWKIVVNGAAGRPPSRPGRRSRRSCAEADDRRSQFVDPRRSRRRASSRARRSTSPSR